MCNSCHDCLTDPCKQCEKLEIVLCINCGFFKEMPTIPQGGICKRLKGIDSVKSYDNACRYGIKNFVY